MAGGVWRSWVLSFTWYSRPESSSFSFHYLWILPLILYFTWFSSPSLNLAPWSRSPFVWLRGYIYTQPRFPLSWLQRYRYIHFSCLSKMHLPLKTHSFPLLHFIWISVTVIPQSCSGFSTRSSIPLSSAFTKYSSNPYPFRLWENLHQFLHVQSYDCWLTQSSYSKRSWLVFLMTVLFLPNPS